MTTGLVFLLGDDNNCAIVNSVSPTACPKFHTSTLIMAEQISLRADGFPRLANPPIVEASIHWRARTSHAFDESQWKSAFAEKLPSYSKVSATQKTLRPGGSGGPAKMSLGVEGLQISIPDGHYYARATVDGLRFTTKLPYSGWDSFVGEALCVWRSYCKILQPSEVQRITLRMVNRFSGVTASQVAEILKEPPSCPAGYTLQDFTYQSNLLIPDEPYAVRIVKHLPSNGLVGLILDISAYTLEPSEPDNLASLPHLRKLKNTVFFSLVAASEISKRTTS